MLLSARSPLLAVLLSIRFPSFLPTQPASPEVATPAPARISALGRLEPEAEILQLAPPSALENDRLLELRVKDGDTVKAGEVLAVLDSRDRLQDELQQAQAQVAIAQSKLAQVRAGAKTGEISAQASQVKRLQAQRQGDLTEQRAAIAKLKAQLQGDLNAQRATLKRLVAELRNAQVEYNRYQKLQAAGAIGLQEKRPDLKIEQVITAEAGDIGTDILYRQFHGLNVPGTNLSGLGKPDPINEVVFYHKPSRTLIITDIAFHFDETNAWETRLAGKLIGGYKALQPTLLEKWWSKDRALVERSIRAVLEWDFDRVIMAHGSIIETNGKAMLKAGYEWLLDTQLD